MKNAVDKYEQDIEKMEEEKNKLIDKISNAQAGKEETVKFFSNFFNNSFIFASLKEKKTFAC